MNLKSFYTKIVKIDFRWLLLVLSLIYLLVRLVGLGSDILNSDGSLWYRRSSNFLSAIENRKYIETYQHYQPGVTLMWVRSFADYFTGVVLDLINKPRWYIENYAYFVHIHAITKSTLVLVLFSLYLYQILLVRKIFGVKTALIFGLIAAVEPYLIGIDRWFHLISLEAYFSFSAFLTILYWNRKDFNDRNRLWALILSGSLYGLSVLSKTTGIISLLPILVVLILNSCKNKNSVSKFYTFLNFALFAVAFVLTLFLVFPALSQDFNYVTKELFDAIRDASKVTGARSFGSVISGFYYYARIFVFKLSPVTLMLLLSAIIYGFKKKNEFYTLEVKAIVLYVLSFYALLSIASKRADRYSIDFMLPVILFVSIFASRLSSRVLALTVTGILIVTVYVGINNYPVFSNYFSPLLGGEYGAIKAGAFDNNGEYFAQAALYLNQFEKTKICIPNNTEAFKYFSKHEITFTPEEAGYAVYSIDSGRHEAPSEYCGPLFKTFGPKFEKPVIYVYKCVR